MSNHDEQDVPPLASYETMLAEWKVQCRRSAWVSAAFFAAALVANVAIVLALELKNLTWVSWLIVVGVSAAIGAPFYVRELMLKPRRYDVEVNRMLRRSVGLRDDVAEGNQKEM